MNLVKYLGKDVKIDFGDEIVYVKVIEHTSNFDNEEPDDNGNNAGEYITVRALNPTKHFRVGEEFTAMLYEIKNIKEIN